MFHARTLRFASNFLRCYKLMTTVAIVICVTGSIVVVNYYMRQVPVRDDYSDDFVPQLFDKVFQRWYNSTGKQKWYNNDYISMFDPHLVAEIRKSWIIDKSYDSSVSYGLRQPDVWDPSMGQARAIMNILRNKTNGFFIESGAYDGETRSNTLVLERFFGWSGILIEPDPINFTKMLTRKRTALMSPSCLSIERHPINVSFLQARNIGRIHEAGTTDDGANSATDYRPTNSPDIAHTGRHTNVQCFPLASYIAALDVKTVDYFSLDVEGSEMQVLETIPFEHVDITTLSVEYIHGSHTREYMIDFMGKKGYYAHSFVEHPDNLANDVIFVKNGF